MSEGYVEQRFWYLHQLRQLRAQYRVNGLNVRHEYVSTQKMLAKIRKDRVMAEAATATTTTPAAAKAPGTPKAAAGTPKAPKAPKEAKPKTAAGHSHDAKITLLKDKEGKQYSAENNPKRTGSAAHKLFMKYKDQMTVGDFIKAGGRASALKYDSEHGFIKIG